MKIPAIAILSTLLALSSISTPTRAAEPRHGVITSLQPIENRGDDENPEVEQNRKIGRMAGVGASLGLMMAKAKRGTGLGKAGVVATAAAPDIGAKVAEKIGGDGPTTRFMVKVKLDNRKVLSITQLRKDLGDLKEGDRIIVTGTGDSAQVSRE